MAAKRKARERKPMNTPTFTGESMDLWGVAVPAAHYEKIKRLGVIFFGMTSNDTPEHLARKWAAKHAFNVWFTARWQAENIVSKMKKDALELYLED